MFKRNMRKHIEAVSKVEKTINEAGYRVRKLKDSRLYLIYGDSEASLGIIFYKNSPSKYRSYSEKFGVDWSKIAMLKSWAEETGLRVYVFIYCDRDKQVYYQDIETLGETRGRGRFYSNRQGIVYYEVSVFEVL